MNIIAFSYSLDGLMLANIKKVLQQFDNVEFIASDEEILRCKINLKARLPQSLKDLREAEAIINTGNIHEKRTFGNIMSAANAEISAIEDPLLMTIKDNVLTIPKTTILDLESTEFEMMFFYLQNYVTEFLMQLLVEQFDLNKVKVEISSDIR